MLKRSIVIGGMIAGAFLLPNVASAGKVKGACVNCHTMHNSQDNLKVYGVQGEGRRTLLAADCAGCHAVGGPGSNDANGLNSTGIPAPQVNDSTNILSGGYFSTSTADNTHHNVFDIYDTDTDGVLKNLPPGGTDMGHMLTCEDCHQGSGGHHGTAGGYRLLSGVTGTPAAKYGVNTAAAAGVGKRSANEYRKTMNDFCASCHTKFHGTYQESGTAGTWIRHPTDISMAGAGPSIVAGYDNTLDTDVIPVGSDGTNNDIVLCLSCHVPHGGANADLLSFNYGGSGSYAGDGDATGKGCETCHSYTGGGM